MTFKLAIIGRPNVGKSTLFNRLVGKRLALVDDTPGVTRDRRQASGTLGQLKFEVIDTAGLEEAAGDSLEARMRAQTERAIREADICLFMVDARAGVTPSDSFFAGLLRKSSRPVILVTNKAEGRAGEAGYLEAFSLGFGDPVPISAEHGEGLADLHDAIVAALGEERAFGPAQDEEEIAEEGEADDEARGEESDDADASKPLRIAVVGRPNSGKSTLLNRLVGEDRLLTGPEAGITRDAIAIDWQWKGRPVRLHDTAGLRKKAKVQEKLEKLSVADALRAMQFAEVVVVLFDATQPFEKQDLHIADLVIREGRALVLAVNKWDLVDDRQARLAEMHEKAERLLPQVKGLKLVPVSGLTGDGIDQLMQAVFDVHDAWNRRIPTAALNRWLEGTVHRHPPPAVSGRRIRVKYITQIKSRPPTFIAACSRPAALPEAYNRYMVNALREEFDLWGTPIRLFFRKGDNPYAGRARKRT